jgi:hypothetical protein
MKHIFGPRGSGRTYTCMKECAENNAYFLVANSSLLETYKYLAQAYGFKEIIPRIIVFTDVEKLPTNAPVVIDDAEFLLHSYFAKVLKSELIACSFCTKDVGDNYIDLSNSPYI